ncbi:MAG: CDP-alcohol phosphatidyltransferase family protein [Clostridia bacterium]|nr:CDP-alcohol phosphatidyltransferase family protein [Clostridia bacterium]
MSDNKYLTIPNFLSVSRALFLPVLFYFVHSGQELAFLIGYIILGSTDFFDGQIARRFNQKTDIGKALDSIADLFFYISSAYFLAVLYPQYLMPNRVLLIVFFSLLGLSFVVSGIMCKKPIMMHTSLLRLGGVLVYAAIIASYFMNTTWFIAIVLINYLIGFSEEIAIFIKYGEVDPDTTTIFRIIPKVKPE